ncbi:MAG TPA: hypothetical protein VFO03_11540 [Gaiellaceae bacterium]|nr:hypothetical protein [Gaiellaceae bacterium]
MVVNFVIDVVYGFIDPRARADIRAERPLEPAETPAPARERATQPAT